MPPKVIVSLVGVLLAVVGFVVLLLPVSISSAGGTSIACGSGLSASGRDAELYGTGQSRGQGTGAYARRYVEQCASAVAGRRWVGWPLIVLGVVVVGIGVALAARDVRREGVS